MAKQVTREEEHEIKIEQLELEVKRQEKELESHHERLLYLEGFIQGIQDTFHRHSHKVIVETNPEVNTPFLAISYKQEREDKKGSPE